MPARDEAGKACHCTVHTEGKVEGVRGRVIPSNLQSQWSCCVGGEGVQRALELRKWNSVAGENVGESELAGDHWARFGSFRNFVRGVCIVVCYIVASLVLLDVLVEGLQDALGIVLVDPAGVEVKEYSYVLVKVGLGIDRCKKHG